MIEAFRVEHRKTGVGPFQTPGRVTQYLAAKASRHAELRYPGDDGLGLSYTPWAFKFASPCMQTLRQWMLPGRTDQQNLAIVRRLDQMGFVIAQFLIEEDNYLMGLSGNQLAIDTFSAKEDGLAEYFSVFGLIHQNNHPLQLQ